jgi:dCTP deaminase
MSVDLTLADKGATWKKSSTGPLHPAHPSYNYTGVTKQLHDPITFPFEVKPDILVLGWTREVISLPMNGRLAARVEGKSNLARIGLGIHVTAPTIHAGFSGPIQLELVNFGVNNIILDPGMNICQLIFEMTTGTPIKGYEGQFQNQRP